MMPLMVGTEKRKTRSKPVFVAQNSLIFSGATGANATLSIPATAQDGDFAIYAVSCRDDTKTVVHPADVDKIYDTRDFGKHETSSGSSSPDGLSVYTEWITSGDVGASRTFKSAGSAGTEQVIIGVAIYRGVKRIAVHPLGTQRHVGSWSSSKPFLSSTSWGKDNLIVGCIGSRGSLNADSCLITALESAYTIRTNVSGPGGLVTASGVAIFDGSTHGLSEEDDITMFSNTSVPWANVMIELSGEHADGWDDYERVPASLAGKPVYIYGTSNTCMIAREDVGAPNEPKWTTYNSYPEWLRRAIDPALLGNHMGIPGTNAADNTTFAYGTEENNTQALTADLLTDPASIIQAGTFHAQANRDLGGLVLLDIFGNDILSEASPSSQVRDGATIAADALVRLVRAKYVRNNVYTGTTYGGTWNQQTSTGAVDGGYGRTLKNGATVTIVTSDPKIELLLLAVDSGALANPGAPFTIHVDGVLRVTDTTHNRLKLGSSLYTPTYNFVQMAIPLDLGPGSHTVVLTHTGVDNTDSLRYQGYLVPKTVDAEIPWVVLLGMQRMAPVAQPDQSLETMAAYLTLARTVASRFTSKVLVYDPHESGVWYSRGYDLTSGGVGSGGAFSVDGIHMNNVGHAFFAQDLLRFLNERIA